MIGRRGGEPEDAVDGDGVVAAGGLDAHADPARTNRSWREAAAAAAVSPGGRRRDEGGEQHAWDYQTAATSDEASLGIALWAKRSRRRGKFLIYGWSIGHMQQSFLNAMRCASGAHSDRQTDR
jgi:hypothetical protein